MRESQLMSTSWPAPVGEAASDLPPPLPGATGRPGAPPSWAERSDVAATYEPGTEGESRLVSARRMVIAALGGILLVVAVVLGVSVLAGGDDRPDEGSVATTAPP